MKIVYQAYGRQDIVQQVLFSIATLKSKAGGALPAMVEIYTDRAESLQGFFAGEKNVRFVSITPQEIIAYRGAIDFVHRVKLKILERASADFDEPIIYLDGDVFFQKDPTALFAKITSTDSLMHICESRLDEAKDPLTKKIAKFIKKNEFTIDDKTWKMPLETEMWNAGVIGIHPANKYFFHEMLELTDQMYSRYQKHVMEQLAVSYVLQRKTKIHSSHLEIIHYWASKEAFDSAIQKYLSDKTTLKAATDSLAQFEWPALIQRKEKKSWFTRLFGSVKP